jgi:hypothetical protein
MWVLFVMIFGAQPTVQMHDFEDRQACAHALEMVQTALAPIASGAYCVERGHSVLGPHEVILIPQHLK